MIVRIETPSADIPTTGVGTKVTTMDGHPIKGVSSIDIRIRPNEATLATLGIWGAFLGEAKAEFKISDPVTGDLKSVKRIEFTDGTVWNDDPQA